MVSIGVRLREEYWKCGIGTEATKLMTDYLFKETDIEIITAITMSDNQKAVRSLEKNGFISTYTVHKEDWGRDEPAEAYRWFL